MQRSEVRSHACIPRILYALIAVIGLISSACSLKGGIQTFSEDGASIDLTKSTVTIIGDNADADGLASAVVKITLRDKDNAPVAGYTPTIVSSDPSVVVSNCTKSDNQGISTCQAKSTDPGKKSIQVQIAGSPIPTAVTFVSVKGQTPGFSAGAANTSTLTGTGMVMVTTYGEVASDNLIVVTDGVSPGVDSIESGVILTAQSGTQKTAHPTLPNPAYFYKPMAMANMSGILYPVP